MGDDALCNADVKGGDVNGELHLRRLNAGEDTLCRLTAMLQGETLLCPVAPLRGFPGILAYGFPFLPFVLKCDIRYTRGSCVPHPSLASVLACVEYLV